MKMLPFKTISILGCGWLGIPLALKLIDEGLSVRGSSGSRRGAFKLLNRRIPPAWVKASHDKIRSISYKFWQSDIIIISIPPKRKENAKNAYPALINQIVKRINNSSIKSVIFISSTSVYPLLNSVVYEKDVHISANTKACDLLKAEKIISQLKCDKTIIRFGGLIGPGRLPGIFLRKKKTLPAGNAPLNLIVQLDAINAIFHCIENNLWNETYNAVSPEHPVRNELYAKAAELSKSTPISLKDKSGQNFYKTVNSAKLIETGFKFKFKNPIDALTELYKNDKI